MQEEECESKLAALPITSGNSDVTGRSQGCRALHSSFASANTKHCPHLSFDPKRDVNGKIKCQDSLSINPSDLFDEEDFIAYEEFNYEVGISSAGFYETQVEGKRNACTAQEGYLQIDISNAELDDLYSEFRCLCLIIQLLISSLIKRHHCGWLQMQM